MHVTQLLKKESEAETPKGKGGGKNKRRSLTLGVRPPGAAELGASLSRSGSREWGRRSQGGP